MAMFPKGTTVHQVAEVVAGKVKAFSVDQTSGEVQCLVEWEDGDGNVHSRFFGESQLAANETVRTVGIPME